MKKILFVFGVTIAVISCTPRNTEIIEDVTDTTMPKTAIAEGKVVYMKKCAACHDLKTVDNYTSAQWSGILPKMIDKAELNEEESSQVSAYVKWELEN